MHAGFSQFAAFDQDALDNKAFLAKGKLTVPVLAMGGEKSFGSTMAAVMRFAATDVTELVIPNSGHWLMEEQHLPRRSPASSLSSTSSRTRRGDGGLSTSRQNISPLVRDLRSDDRIQPSAEPGAEER